MQKVIFGMALSIVLGPQTLQPLLQCASHTASARSPSWTYPEPVHDTEVTGNKTPELLNISQAPRSKDLRKNMTKMHRHIERERGITV